MEANTRKPTYDELVDIVAALRAHIAKRDLRIAQLETQLASARKISRNSSKPPSSYIAKPPKNKPKRRDKRKNGAQQGHPKHYRLNFTPDQIDNTVEHAPQACPDCGGKLGDSGEATTLQQAELVQKPIFVTEHRTTPKRCSCCGKTIKVAIPAEIRVGGLCGPRLTAFAAFLKGGCHASTTIVQSAFTDILGLPVSSGFIMKMLRKTTTALDEPYAEALQRLPEAEAVNADETGHKENGGNWWTWVFRTARFTLFRIADSRGCKVLYDTLGP